MGCCSSRGKLRDPMRITVTDERGALRKSVVESGQGLVPESTATPTAGASTSQGVAGHATGTASSPPDTQNKTTLTPNAVPSSEYASYAKSTHFLTGAGEAHGSRVLPTQVRAANQPRAETAVVPRRRVPRDDAHHDAPPQTVRDWLKDASSLTPEELEERERYEAERHATLERRRRRHVPHGATGTRDYAPHESPRDTPPVSTQRRHSDARPSVHDPSRVAPSSRMREPGEAETPRRDSRRALRKEYPSIPPRMSSPSRSHAYASPPARPNDVYSPQKLRYAPSQVRDPPPPPPQPRYVRDDPPRRHEQSSAAVNDNDDDDDDYATKKATRPSDANVSLLSLRFQSENFVVSLLQLVVVCVYVFLFLYHSL